MKDSHPVVMKMRIFYLQISPHSSHITCDQSGSPCWDLCLGICCALRISGDRQPTEGCSPPWSWVWACSWEAGRQSSCCGMAVSTPPSARPPVRDMGMSTCHRLLGGSPIYRQACLLSSKSTLCETCSAAGKNPRHPDLEECPLTSAVTERSGRGSSHP